jgi:hypothetical protein
MRRLRSVRRWGLLAFRDVLRADLGVCGLPTWVPSSRHLFRGSALARTRTRHAHLHTQCACHRMSGTTTSAPMAQRLVTTEVTPLVPVCAHGPSRLGGDLWPAKVATLGRCQAWCDSHAPVRPQRAVLLARATRNVAVRERS